MAEPREVLELFETIANLRPWAVTFEGTIVRSVGTRYANENDFLSGRGAAQTGGRWSPRGVRAIYASLDVVTATREAYANFLVYGFPLSAIRPRVMAGATARLQVVLDLNDRRTRGRTAFTLTDLTQEDWAAIQAGGEESWTQAIGRGARAAGFEAILVPSARCRAGRNIVIFPENIAKGSSLKLLSPQELPPHPRDWPD